MYFIPGAVLIVLTLLFLSAQCVENRDCKSVEQDYCDKSASSNSNREENGISSLFEISEENLNLSLKWPYMNNGSSSTNILSVHQNLISFSVAQNFSIKNETLQNDLHEDIIINEMDYLKTIALRLSSLSRPFNASRRPSASLKCREHTKLFFNSLRNLELWALKMHDSSARLSSGILNGNVNQFGDFDQCMDIIGPTQGLQGQYCLAYMQPSVSKQTKYLKSLMNLIQSHEAFKSEFYDAGHRVPRFSLINWGLCVPSTCTPEDIQYSLKEYIKELTFGTGINFQIRIEPQMCYVQTPTVIDFHTKLVIGFFIAIISIAILSTVYECSTDKEQQNELLVAFSLRKNCKWLFNTKSAADDISAVHGIRFTNALLLLFAHKSLTLFFVPYMNRTYMSESLGKSWTVIGRAASIYTDPFLLFSGMLTSYSIIGRLQRGQSIRLKHEYIGRLLRIIPTLGALILFCTFILPKLSTGPQWNLVIGHHSYLCKKNWWKNLLFIHNYFGFSEMCLTHTHHLGIDTELFLVAPPMVLVLWKWPKKGFIALISLAAIGTAARFHTTIVNQLSNYVYFGTSIQRLFKTADYMYSSPPHRSTVYILGILLGYALRKFKDAKLSKRQLRYGWTIALLCCFITIFGPAPMGDINYKYNSIHAAIYAAFAPIGWCAYFSWIVFVSHLGYKNKLTRMMSWRGFQITTKLSYAIYLTQFPTFFFNVGRRRHADYFSFLPLMFDLNENVCIIIASILLTLLFDAPFQNIKKILFRKRVNLNQSINYCNNNVKKLD